jgi:hypothetical protein
LYFTTDKDFINIHNIDSFLSFLTHIQNLSCGYCEYLSKFNAKNEIYLQGSEAIKRVGYIGHHPSGYFFNRAKLESINYREKFSDKEFVGEFYLDFILAELSLEGNVGIFNENLTIPQDNSDAAKDKSLSIKGLQINAYYTPEARLKMALNQTTHINGLKLYLDEKKQMIFKVFIRGLANATYGYKNILNNQNICEHYQLENKEISLFKLFFIGFNYYIQYIKNTKIIRLQNNLNTFSFNVYIFKIFLNKMKNRFGNV